MTCVHFRMSCECHSKNFAFFLWFSAVLFDLTRLRLRCVGEYYVCELFLLFYLNLHHIVRVSKPLQKKWKITFQ